MPEMQCNTGRADRARSVAATVRRVWFADCKSLRDQLVAPVSRDSQGQAIVYRSCTSSTIYTDKADGHKGHLAKHDLQNKLGWIDAPSMHVRCSRDDHAMCVQCSANRYFEAPPMPDDHRHAFDDSSMLARRSFCTRSMLDTCSRFCAVGD